jgi:hypothetical protein
VTPVFAGPCSPRKLRLPALQGKPITGGVLVFELEAGEPSSSSKDQLSGPLRATVRIRDDGKFHLQADLDQRSRLPKWQPAAAICRDRQVRQAYSSRIERRNCILTIRL